jgi:fructose-specific phosphotransferase system IIC component
MTTTVLVGVSCFLAGLIIGFFLGVVILISAQVRAVQSATEGSSTDDL